MFWAVVVIVNMSRSSFLHGFVEGLICVVRKIGLAHRRGSCSDGPRG